MDELDFIKKQLTELKNEDESKRGNDVIHRTISTLLAIEKRSMYGALRGKESKIEEAIKLELNNYKESRNAIEES